MHWIAALLALAAVVCFLVEWYTAAPPRRPLPLGLALLTIAWMVQLIVLTGSHFKVN
ncbi:MAG TPA: hypothetical protein VFI41_04860 [Gemmatimonadales bacterium]|nr:hypothetical protein [Gemmatimonadales bacterium]